MSKILVIKADEELFDQWKLIGHKIMAQKAIVQNDMEIPVKELQEWLKNCDGLIKELGTLIDDTCKHVTKETKDA